MMTKESREPKERASHVVSVRLTDEDRELVAQVAGTLGVSASKAVRLMLRRADGGTGLVRQAPVIEELRQDLDDVQRAFDLLSRQLSKIGGNLNQLAKNANAGLQIDARAIPVLEDCRIAVDRMRWKLNAKPGELMRGLGLDALLEKMESCQ